jgi:hypothetical protein
MWFKTFFELRPLSEFIKTLTCHILLLFSASGEQDTVVASTKLYLGLQQYRFSFVSCSPADGNRTSIRNMVVPVNSNVTQNPK